MLFHLCQDMLKGRLRKTGQKRGQVRRENVNQHDERSKPL